MGGRPLVSTFAGSESLIFLGAHGGQVADPMIEAKLRPPEWLLVIGVWQLKLNATETSPHAANALLPVVHAM